MKRKDRFALQCIGGQDILVPLGAAVIDMNCIITLNPTGRRVWELLAEDRSLDELTAAVTEEFDVDSEQARSSIQAFLDDIGRIGVLET